MQSREPARFRCRDGCSAVDWLSRFCQSSAKSNPYGFRADDGQSRSYRKSFQLPISRRLVKVDRDKRACQYSTHLVSLAKSQYRAITTVAFSPICRFVSSSSGGLASARESLCRGLGSGWFTERLHRNALVTHFQHGQVFCAARRLENYAVARCRLHQRAP